MAAAPVKPATKAETKKVAGSKRGESAAAKVAPPPPGEATGKLSPAAKRLVEEHRLEAREIAGSGRDGRITKSDIAQHLEVGVAKQLPGGGRIEQRVPMSRLRARIDRLGPVNMMAIDQFEELETRHVFLTTQRKDLVDSIPDPAMNRVVGDIAAHEVSAGLAYKWSRYTFAGTWNARFGERDIPLNAVNPSPGHYDAIVQAISLAVGVSL